MRKTISRSSTLAFVALACFGSGLAAQEDTTMVAQERPEVHLVSEGETLWDIATRYFGDPYLWPEIYRLNTLVVEDPHWIFPGEELVLIDREPEPVAAVPEPTDTAAMVDDGGQGELQEQAREFDAGAPPAIPETNLFRPRTVTQGLTFGGRGRDLYRAVRRSEFYTAGFLTEGEDLPLGEVRGAVGAARGRIMTATSAVINEDLELLAPRSAAYQIGDSLLLIDQQREISGWGHVMIPTGIVVVTNVAGRRAIARVVTQFELILDGQFSMHLEPFRDPGDVRPEPVESEMVGEIIEIRDQHPVPNQQDVVFIDLGRTDGIVPGDIFNVVRESRAEGFEGGAEERIATVRIVHVRENSASGMLTHIYQNAVRSGAKVRLTHKMPT